MSRGDWYVDKKEICDRCCISPKYFDLHFKKDPRMKVIEFYRPNKSWWATDKVKKVVDEIMEELRQN